MTPFVGPGGWSTLTGRVGYVKTVLALFGISGLLVVALTGCSAAQAAPARAGDAGPTAAASSSATPSAVAAPGATTSPSVVASPSTGCSATRTGIPTGAHVRETVDVDGDGAPDREWLSKDGRTFGITTASGATSTVPVRFSSGAGPEAMTAKLPGTATIISEVGDDRRMAVYRYEHCGLHPVTDTQGAQWRFDLTGAHGYGIGCADLTGSGEDTLVGYQLDTPYGSLKDHEQVRITTAAVRLSGTTATPGKIVTATTELPGGKATLDHVTTVSCGSTTITADGVHL